MSEAWVVNTNLTYDKKLEKRLRKKRPRATVRYTYRLMREEEAAYAFGDQAYRLAQIDEDDLVFLYHNRAGICGVGRAADFIKKAKKRYRGEEAYFVPLRDFLMVDPYRHRRFCIPYRDLSAVIGRKGRVGVRNTCFKLRTGTSEGKRLEKALRKRAAQRPRDEIEYE